MPHMIAQINSHAGWCDSSVKREMVHKYTAFTDQTLNSTLAHLESPCSSYSSVHQMRKACSKMSDDRIFELCGTLDSKLR